MIFKEYILWSQGDTRAAESPIIIDGERVGDREGNEAFSYISTVNGICEWHAQRILDDIKKRDVEFANEISPSLNLFINDQYDILITSHFTDVDDAGRRIVYAFCSKGDDFQKAAERLQEASGLIGRTCNTADIKALERLRIKKKSKTLIIVLILLALMMILTIILLYHFGYINFNTIESLWTKIKNN